MHSVPFKLVLLLASLTLAAGVRAQDSNALPPSTGVSIQADNDLFSGAHHDRDYSWGLAITLPTSRPNVVTAPLQKLQERIDTLFVDEEDVSRSARAVQVGLLAMTPKNLLIADAQPNDRPYASLLFITSSRIRIADDAQHVDFTALTLGVLGLDAAQWLQRNVHEAMSGKVPQGWNHQISDGGEFTARYVRARQWLVTRNNTDGTTRPEIKLTLAGSAGYLTEASGAVMMRYGRVYSDWWSFSPELGDYTAAPIAPVFYGDTGAPELYAFIGARVKARAYNALLQGQFRHSDVRVDLDDVAHWQADAWAGVTSGWSQWRVTYIVRLATKEIVAPEPAARTLLWAGLSVERVF